jgi:hypothetical protein
VGQQPAKVTHEDGLQNLLILEVVLYQNVKKSLEGTFSYLRRESTLEKERGSPMRLQLY